ncbi:MAG: hypothetical protein DMG13_13125, partial [Acidobacteria bacterium]
RRGNALFQFLHSFIDRRYSESRDIKGGSERTRRHKDTKTQSGNGMIGGMRKQAWAFLLIGFVAGFAAL